MQLYKQNTESQHPAKTLLQFWTSDQNVWKTAILCWSCANVKLLSGKKFYYMRQIL